MKLNVLMLTAAPIALLSPPVTSVAVAGTRAGTATSAKRPAAGPAATQDPAAKAPAPKVNAEAAFSTGVAKGRDRLDSATSTSALKESEIVKLGAHSLADILRNIPGVRTESATGDGNSNYTIHGRRILAVRFLIRNTQRPFR